MEELCRLEIFEGVRLASGSRVVRYAVLGCQQLVVGEIPLARFDGEMLRITKGTQTIPAPVRLEDDASASGMGTRNNYRSYHANHQ